ncbi:MAG: hypothetical protein IIV48_07225, partial [Clostridium sp.]|nr:hypothetical protein [Clostridium sp.]
VIVLLAYGQRVAEDGCALLKSKPSAQYHTNEGFSYVTQIHTDFSIFFQLLTSFFHFLIKCAIIPMLPLPAWQTGKGGVRMEMFITLFLTIVGGVIVGRINKWLDGK